MMDIFQDILAILFNIFRVYSRENPADIRMKPQIDHTRDDFVTL